MKRNNAELLMKNDHVKTYYTKLPRPYWSIISIIWIFIGIGFLTLASASIVEPLNKTTSVFFHKMGKAYTHIDDWNVLTNFNLSKIQEKISTLKSYDEPALAKLEPYISRARVDHLDTTILADINHIEKQFHNLFSTVKYQSKKRTRQWHWSRF